MTEKAKIVVVNGENYWQEFFPDFDVVQIKIQHSQWILKNQKLYVIFDNQIIEPAGILWRVGAIRPTAIQQTALCMIALSNVPCINSATSLLKGFDRLSMLSELKSCDLPTVNYNIISHSSLSKNLTQEFPFVIKAGNYHGGFGKVLVKDSANWQDIQDLLFTNEDYIVAEPYIDYVRDIRYLLIGDKAWAMARKGKFWKANVQTTDFALIDLDKTLLAKFKKITDSNQC
ncbi:hypothetical protein [Acinetobacter sp. c3-l95]|uniref:hypothetical protein n=1 Tax=Acinetobacter sp. c3-l95 TaxID=3342804 RepID=UPI0035B77565